MDPNIVAKAYAVILTQYRNCFRLVEFAVYCGSNETENFDAFRRAMERFD